MVANMLNNRLNLRRAARVLSRGGFTLVELLVVIGIIAILAGVALGPITNGIKKAKQSSGLQSAHALGLAMYSCANDNSQLYPDNNGGDAHNIAQTLLAGGYVTDPGIFFLSGDTASTAAKYSLTTNPAINIAKSNVSWDFMGNGGSGVSTTSNTYLPILWSTVNAGTQPTPIKANPNAVTAAPVATNPFGTDGMAMFYVNNSAAFVTSTITGGAYSVTMVSGSNNTGAALAYNTLSGL
jgi:prepilin-type N-terminal cleavage/methylation domain-containing protein